MYLGAMYATLRNAESAGGAMRVVGLTNLFVKDGKKSACRDAVTKGW
jgi:hypothetical protein